jgi:hypothetical protein
VGLLGKVEHRVLVESENFLHSELVDASRCPDCCLLHLGCATLAQVARHNLDVDHELIHHVRKLVHTRRYRCQFLLLVTKLPLPLL